MSNTQGALLVTGASGHLGHRVIELLLENAPGRQVIALTRSPSKLADLASRGVEVRAADFDQADTLAAAFADAERVLIVSTDALERPGHRLQQHRSALKAARAAGAKHVVYTSLTTPGPESLVSLAPDHWGTEESIRESGLGHTLLRNNMYTDYLLFALPHAVQTGKLVNAYGAGAISYVTREDCARIAAAALSSEFSGKRALDVTGPAAVTQAELAAWCTELTGRKVEYLAVDAASATQGMIAGGLPAPVAELMATFMLSGAKGQLSVVSPAVQELTGKAPGSVRDHLAANRAALG